MIDLLNRRQALIQTGLATAVGVGTVNNVISANATQGTERPDDKPFGYCFNTSTFRGQQLTLPEQIKVVAAAGYDGIEPWIGEIRNFVAAGGSLKDLRKQIIDSGLTVESAIGFAHWIVDDEITRSKGLDDAKRDMELIHSIGGRRLAAPPAGATGPLDLNVIAQRYRTLLELGGQVGVVPQLELWGSSPAISRVSQLAYIAAESGHPDACVLPDFYHIYKGGSDFNGLRVIAGKRMHVFHMNDYPAQPPRQTIGDQHRVYPGDGIAPLARIIRELYTAGFRGAFSLELFNPSYWQQDARKVAKTGLTKMQTVIDTALQS